MAKALYGFITYPESIKTEEMKQWLSETLGVEWACCLHDKDVTKEGTPKKPHVHWLIGFDKSKKSIKDLLKIFASRWYYVASESVSVNRKDVEKFVDCLTVEGVEVPPIPAIPSVEVGNVAKPLVTRFLQMYSAQGAEDYLEHKNSPQKAQYIGLSEKSEFWNVNDYLTYSEKRTAKKLDSAGEISQLLKYIRQTQISDYVSLLDSLAVDSPELLSLAFQKAYSVEKYLSGWKLADRCKKLESENEKLRDDLDYYKTEIERLEDYQQEITCLQNVIEENAVKMAELSVYYRKTTGENPDIE